MLTAIDRFAGASSATEGQQQVGFHILAAVENDTNAASTFDASFRRSWSGPRTSLW